MGNGHGAMGAQHHAGCPGQNASFANFLLGPLASAHLSLSTCKVQMITEPTS